MPIWHQRQDPFLEGATGVRHGDEDRRRIEQPTAFGGQRLERRDPNRPVLPRQQLDLLQMPCDVLVVPALLPSTAVSVGDSEASTSPAPQIRAKRDASPSPSSSPSALAPASRLPVPAIIWGITTFSSAVNSGKR